MRLIVKSPVWDDLREIGLRIAEDNPEAADRFFIAAEEAFELLRRQPHLGRLRSFSVIGVRSWVIPDFQKYIVFYLPRETAVQILAVVHGARDLSSALAVRLD
jgi:plasmid stabilization system protein ParE